jgi:HAD superfamily hydrolase (TIGR01549 family)
MLDALIFDVDGTLVDSVDLHARAWCDAFADFGYHPTFQAVRSQIGKGGDQLIPVFVPQPELERIGEALDKHRGELFAERYLQQVRGFPQVRELFAALRRGGKRLALASSAKGSELTHYKQVAGIEDLIDTETSADQAEHSKPFPDIFQAALERLGEPEKDRCCVIGDTPYDAQAAKRAGLRCIGVLCGGFPEAALRAEGCVAIYREPAHLLAAFDAHGERAFLEQT